MTSPYGFSSSSAADDSSNQSHIPSSRISTPGSSIRPRKSHAPSSSTELAASSDLGLGIGIAGARGDASARDASPIPGKHPSRIASSRSGINGSGSGRPVGGLVDGNSRGNGSGSPTMGFGRGLWGGVWTGSWSAVQGLASSYLGGDINDDSGLGGGGELGGSNGASRKGKGVGSYAAKKKAPQTWGPSGLRQRGESIGAGSSSLDREAALNARKTASVLESHEGVNGGLDITGNYKRRTSMDAPGSPGVDEEALCYVHHVLPTDTQAGVVLKYQCRDAAAFRRANRLYPNDPLQLRKVVLLPVETCTIKGRPCDGPSEDSGGVDLLAPTPSYEDGPSNNDSSNFLNGSTWGVTQEQDNPFASPAKPSAQLAEDNESPWTHVRWVLLSASPSSKPTEIVRLPRKTLGFFPPRRRKSASRVSTPRSSIDLLLPDSPFGTPSRASSILNPTSTSQAGGVGSYFPPSSMLSSPNPNPALSSSLLSPSPLSRRDSTASNLSLSGSTREGRLPQFMRRPGGVGTMARNVRAPGPAQDGFNAWATRQFPTLTIDHLPSLSNMGTNRGGVDNLGFGFAEELASIDEIPNTAHTGGAAVGGGGSWDLGIGNAASGIEGWVRKTMARTPGTPKLKATSHNHNLGHGIGAGVIDGDLIELLDGAGSDDGRGFEPSPAQKAPRNVDVASLGGGGSGRDDLGIGGVASGVRGRGLGGKGKSE